MTKRREKEEGRIRGLRFIRGLLVDYIAGYPLEPCFKREDISVRTKGLYEYAIYMREQGFLGYSLSDAELH